MTIQSQTVVSTWFISDDEDTGTFFPQIGAVSHERRTKNVYWRCIVCFFVSSKAVNPDACHILFTNSGLPIVDGVNVSELFAKLGVQTVELPITFRLKPGTVSAWGNQFYIFDIINWIASSNIERRYIVLDSDCIWIRPLDQLADAVDQYGALTYPLDLQEHDEGPINGLSRTGMGRFLAKMEGVSEQRLEYDGGEIFAANLRTARLIAADLPRYWLYINSFPDEAPKEEAHLLSVLYAKHQIAQGTANPFIKRIWTTLRKQNGQSEDLKLAIWHLPAAKLYGFATMFKQIRSAILRDQSLSKIAKISNYKRVMGVPKLSLGQKVAILIHKGCVRMAASLKLVG